VRELTLTSGTCSNAKNPHSFANLWFSGRPKEPRRIATYRVLGIDEEFEPIGRLFQLSQRVAAFGDKLGFDSSAMGFPEVRSDGGS
jgi:hypothetical protein